MGKQWSALFCFLWAAYFSILKTTFLFLWVCVEDLVQSLSHVWLFATPWTTARQASLPSISHGVCSNLCPLIQRCHPTVSSSVIPFFLHPALDPSQHQGLFQRVSSSSSPHFLLTLSFSCQLPSLRTELQFSPGWAPHSQLPTAVTSRVCAHYHCGIFYFLWKIAKSLKQSHLRNTNTHMCLHMSELLSHPFSTGQFLLSVQRARSAWVLASVISTSERTGWKILLPFCRCVKWDLDRPGERCGLTQAIPESIFNHVRFRGVPHFSLSLAQLTFFPHESLEP